jgi:hypothetical protein
VGRRTAILSEALFWMNIYRDLLAVNEAALVRMRALIQDEAALELGASTYDLDIELVTSETERVRGRHDHWLAIVDRMSSESSVMDRV